MTGIRILLGVFAFGMTAGWLIDYLGRQPGDTHGFFVDQVGRAGTVLIAVFFAWPVLERNAHRIPAVLVGMAAIVALFLIFRPKVIPLVLLACGVFAAIHWGLRLPGARRK